MKGDRKNKVKPADYMEGFYEIRQDLRGDRWHVVDGCVGIDKSFSSLHEARQWCKEHPADPEFEGKWA